MRNKRRKGIAMFLNALLGYLPTTVRVIVGVAVLAVAAIAVRSWVAAHDTDVELRATLAAQKQLIEQAAAREKDRDAALAKTLAGISEVKRAVQTPVQAAEKISQALPSLPEPIQIQVPAPEPGKDVTPLPATASVPQPDLVPLYDYLEDCRACQAQLAAKNNDLTDEHTKVTALTAERDAAVRAARGGGFWARARRTAKWLLIGGALGAVVATAARQH
jgi:hypothetical protein